MKKVLLLLTVLSIQLHTKAQLVTVPNTATFTLQDVYNAVKFHSNAVTGDLSSCFTNAVTQFFDPTYNQDSYAPANSMLRFRNYGPKNSATITTTGTWSTAVSGTTKAVVLMWAGGASGGCGLTTTDFYGGGGGGGGGFAKGVFDVAVSTSYPVSVGIAGTAATAGANGVDGGYSDFTAGTEFLRAAGGIKGVSYANGRTGGNGGGTSSSGAVVVINTYNGGTGATAPLTGASPYSGGGGGGAGTTGAGVNGSGSAGGSSTTIDGGAGGAGSGIASGNGSGGGAYGGGGGGSTRNGNSGAGAAGKVMIYW